MQYLCMYTSNNSVCLCPCISVSFCMHKRTHTYAIWVRACVSVSVFHGCHIVQVYDEHQELTANTILTHFMFSLPFEECPTFSTHLVQHKWVLRFEFTATYHQKGSGWGLGKTNKNPEQITWLLPILVWPPAS